MKTNIFKVFSLLLLISLVIVTSCKKPDPDSQSAEDEARMSRISGDAFAIGNNEAGGGGKSIPDCMDVDRDPDLHTVTITFTNCDFRGATRNGIINITYTPQNSIGDRALDMTLTFENFTVNNVGITGSIETIFGGTYTRPEIRVIASDMVATFNDNKTISWDSDVIYTIVEGFGDGVIENNVVEMSGTSTGVNRDGDDYDATYSSVRNERDCESGYPVSGTVTIESDKGTSVIDFGDGTCDNIISVTNGGITVNVTLN